MENYASNSNASKNAEGQKKKEPMTRVVSGNVKVKDGGLWSMLCDIFIPSDPNGIKVAIIKEVIGPAIKKLVFDIINNGASMWLFDSRASGSGGSTNASRLSYASMYKGDNQMKPVQGGNNRYNFEQYVMENRADAEAVISRMIEAIDEYNAVTVNDFLDLMGIEGNSQDVKWGWKSLDSVAVVRAKDGYVIKLPKVVPLN